MVTCNRTFYSLSGILRRVSRSVWHRQQPLVSLISNLSCRRNSLLSRRACAAFVHRGGSYGRTRPDDTATTQSAGAVQREDGSAEAG